MLETLRKFTTSVRSYEINDKELVINKMFNLVRIPLEDIIYIQIPKDIMRGLEPLEEKNMYRCHEIGKFKSYITEWSNVLVLKLKNGTIALSPDDHNEFIA